MYTSRGERRRLISATVGLDDHSRSHTRPWCWTGARTCSSILSKCTAHPPPVPPSNQQRPSSRDGRIPQGEGASLLGEEAPVPFMADLGKGTGRRREQVRNQEQIAY